jgi:hypothetical protein
MKRLLLGAVAASLVVVAVALSGSQKPTTTSSGDLNVQVEERNPWTHLRLQPADEFHFAVVSDRTGGHRARIFSQAVYQLNLLQPAFVVSVGDLIEGYTQDPKKLAGEWKEFQSFVCKLQMPFFYVPGNHDISNKFQEEHWRERFGRRFYHFLYRDVLFLMLSSDNPSFKGGGTISPEQIEYVQKVLKENPSARWTIVALHRPLWDEPELAKNGWLDVEKALAGRNYTVFAGHIHRYHKFVRQGQNYYQLATTGGGSKLRGLPYGEFDHITWVTMKKDGPLLANILLDGIYPEDLNRTITDEGAYVRTNTKPLHAVRGTVLFEGCAVPGARVIFHLADGKKYVRTADAITDADGTFTLSTYNAFDGAPAGEHAVTVQWREPWLDAQGRPGTSKLPEKYGKVDATPLRATVKAGSNELTLQLSR